MMKPWQSNKASGGRRNGKCQYYEDDKSYHLINAKHSLEDGSRPVHLLDSLEVDSKYRKVSM